MENSPLSSAPCCKLMTDEGASVACSSLGVPSSPKSAVFLNIVQKAVDSPPPFVLNIAEQIFLMDFLKSA